MHKKESNKDITTAFNLQGAAWVESMNYETWTLTSEYGFKLVGY